MRFIRSIIALVFLTVLAGGSAFGQRAQSYQRGRGRSSNSQSFRTQRGNGNYTFQARNLPSEYSLLLTRTLFTANHRGIVDNVPRPSRSSNSTNRTVELVFRGAMCEGTHYLAGVENTGSRRTVWLAEGESTNSPSFKITQIALDHIIVVDRNGRRLVQIGQSLQSGRQISDPTTLPAMANAPRPSVEPE
jgi:hypothetical protein